jgi:hypothetical protein
MHDGKRHESPFFEVSVFIKVCLRNIMIIEAYVITKFLSKTWTICFVLMKTARAGLGKMIILKTFKMRKLRCRSKYLFNISVSIKDMYTQSIAHKFKLFNFLKKS